MAKRVMLAVAGAGKTYYICNSINPKKKNLILAYTHQNIRNIKNELIKSYGNIPTLTTIMTFDSFIYNLLLKPYEPSILNYFEKSYFRTNGITISDPPTQRIKNKHGKLIPNRYYITKDKLEHYVNGYGYYYCKRISQIIMSVKENKNSLIKKAATGINLFYDQIMIDEFQDFRKYDYDLIISLSKWVDNILLVGDYYQHSVSAINNSGKPFKNQKNTIDYPFFKKNLEKLGFLVDDETLKSSRRCPQQICEFINNKLKIEIFADNQHIGKVVILDKDVDSILEDDRIVKLVYKESSVYKFNAVNWSYSKGDTMDNICVILTEKSSQIAEDNFDCSAIFKEPTTINKLYVALSRTKGNLYLVKYDMFQKVKDKYILK